MDKILKFVCTGFLLCSILALCSSAEFGHSCDEAGTPPVTCNSSKPYLCANGSCGCALPATTMHYDTVRDTCVINAEAFGCLEYASGGHMIPVHCGGNAECSSTSIDVPGTCHCIPGTGQEEHLCKPGYAFGPCITNRDCLSAYTTFLICELSICICRNASIWNAASMQCQGLVGGGCNTNPIIPPGPCSTNMDCLNNICNCKPGHKETVDGRCLLNLGESCTSDSDCHPDFPRCSNSTPGGSSYCNCAEGQEERDGQCFILVEQPCNLPNNSATCNIYSSCNGDPPKCLCDPNYAQDGNYCKGLLNADCNPTPDDCYTALNLECTSDSKCGCMLGYKDVGNGGCLADYNTTCSEHANCHPDFPVCEGSLCGCGPGKLYENGECRILLGQGCTPDEDRCYTFSHCNNATTPFCECDDKYSPVGEICKGNPGAACRPFSSDCNTDQFVICDEGNRLCACAPGYHEQADGTCLGELNVPCREDGHCITNRCFEGLCTCPVDTVYANDRCESVYGGSCDPACHEPYNIICNINTLNCTCLPGMHFDPSKNTVGCLSGVGGVCTSHNECVSNGFCYFESSGPGVCRCEPGFVDSGNGTCQAA